jgi:short-subunit dehydrogenase involved in D-alanine esterification of teichoic acids
MSEEWKKSGRELIDKFVETANQVAQSAKEEYERSEIKHSVEEISAKVKDFFAENNSEGRVHELEEKLACQNEKTEILEMKLEKALQRISELEQQLKQSKES